MFSQPEYTALASREEKGLLQEHDAFSTTTNDHDETEPRPHRSGWKSRILVAIHTTLVLCYILASVHLWTSSQTAFLKPTQKYSLAHQALQYELTPFEDPTRAGGFTSQAWLFAGRPRPELEAAWEDLLRNADIRVTNAEMEMLFPERIEESMRFTDGSGYYAQMAVHHNLHCLRGFHKFMNVGYYYPNVTLEEYRLLQVHNVHCLDMLRQAVMCHGDSTPLTMTWDSKLQLAVANWSTPHECVSWESLDGWAEERHVNMSKAGVVVVNAQDDGVRSVNKMGGGRLPIVLDFDKE